MTRFSVKDELTGLDGYVVTAYVSSGQMRYGDYRSPVDKTIEGYGTLSVAEEPSRPDEDSYGDHMTGIVIKVVREGSLAEKFYRVDMRMDSYGSDTTIESNPYEVVPKEVSVTRFERR